LILRKPSVTGAKKAWYRLTCKPAPVTRCENVKEINGEIIATWYNYHFLAPEEALRKMEQLLKQKCHLVG